MTILTPKVSGGKLTVDAINAYPSVIRAEIARRAEEQMLVPHLFSAHAGPIEGGGLQFNRVRPIDLYVEGDVEQRAPGDEYRNVDAVDPDVQVAPAEDWGAAAEILDEQVKRGGKDYFTRVVDQLSNTIARQLDRSALAALHPVSEEDSVSGHDWDSAVMVGPADSITPSSARPSADLSAAQLAADLQGLSVRHDTLIVHPNQAHALRTAYGPDLSAMLESSGITTLHVNDALTSGTAWAVQGGAVGYIGYEEQLTVKTVRHEKRRATELVVFVVPAFATPNLAAAKRLTGLAG